MKFPEIGAPLTYDYYRVFPFLHKDTQTNQTLLLERAPENSGFLE